MNLYDNPDSVPLVGKGELENELGRKLIVGLKTMLFYWHGRYSADNDGNGRFVFLFYE